MAILSTSTPASSAEPGESIRITAAIVSVSSIVLTLLQLGTPDAVGAPSGKST